MASKAVLLRLRDSDTGSGVTRNTLKHLAKVLGVSETDAIHKALAECARAHLPRYKADDGPLTGVERREIAAAVRKKHGRARVIESLFKTKSSRKGGNGRKSVRSAAGPR